MLAWSGTLSVPEFDVTGRDVKIGTLKLDQGEMNFEILCNYGYCKQFQPPDYGLVTIDKETKIIR